jgi:hypothetical protein
VAECYFHITEYFPTKILWTFLTFRCLLYAPSITPSFMSINYETFQYIIVFLSSKISKLGLYLILTFNLQAVSLPFPTGLHLHVFQIWGTSDPDIVVKEVEVVLSMDCYVPYRPRVITTLPPFPGRNKEMLQRHFRLQGVSPVSHRLCVYNVCKKVNTLDSLLPVTAH